MSDVTPETPDTMDSQAVAEPNDAAVVSASRARRVHAHVMTRVRERHFVRNGILTLALLVGGAIVGILLEHGLRTPDGATRMTQFQDWRVVCPPMSQKDLACTLSNSFARDAGGGTLAMLSIGSTASDAQMNIIVPHGVLLDPGLMFTIADTTPQTRPYETCDNIGCVALVNLDGAMLTALRTKSQGQVQVAAMGQAQPVALPFSLAGFDEGYADLQRENSRRSSFLSFLYR